jgi:peptide/nickel transport system ATP-binding protein
MGNLLEIKNLTTGFNKDETFTPVINRLNFAIKEGEILGLVGESGSGKSVTSLSIMRLLHDTPGEIIDGEVLYKGTDLLKLSEAEMRRYRGKELSMIFQEPMTSLNPVLKIGKQMVETIVLHLKMSKNEAKSHAIKMLESVGIPRAHEIMNEYIHQLSGGMRQRVMIAMQLSCHPSLLIADEPTTALDVTIQAQILNLLKNVQDNTQMGILLITHDLGVVAEVCDRVIVMYAGRIVEEATTEELFENPRHPYTRGLIDSIPKIGVSQKRLYAIPGTVPNPSEMPKGCKFAPRCAFAMERCIEQEPDLIAVGSRTSRCWLEVPTEQTEEEFIHE